MFHKDINGCDIVQSVTSWKRTIGINVYQWKIAPCNETFMFCLSQNNSTLRDVLLYYWLFVYFNMMWQPIGISHLEKTHTHVRGKQKLKL